MSYHSSDFENRIHSLDVSLFDAIPSQSTPEDRRSLLSLQQAVRNQVPEYTYLEVGSYMGGSIQPYLLDPRCRRIYSIDARPAIPPDARGILQTYPENSTQRMLDLPRSVSAEGIAKIACFDADASAVDPAAIEEKPVICFVDGEHTDAAVLSDFAFCREVMAGKGVICLHDANIIFGGLLKIIDKLQSEGARFNAFVLPLHVFVFELDDFVVHDTPDIQPMLLNNHAAYLAGLKSNEHYRDVYNSKPVRLLRFFHRRLLDIQNPRRIPHHLRKK
jgi:hypothetical protein